MRSLHRFRVFLFLGFLLSACSGGGISGEGPSGGIPSGGGPVGGAGDTAAEPGPGLAVQGGPIMAQAAGDGTLGSQSSNSDLVPKIYREFTLFFAGETPAQRGPGFSYVLPGNPGTLPSAEVKKIEESASTYSETACPSCVGRWVRAVNCGAYADTDIEALIPADQKDGPLAKNLLLWFLLRMPRPNYASNPTVCESARYRDFPVKAGGNVDLSGMELLPNEIVVFYLLEANPADDVGPLATNGYGQISKEGIAASSKRGLIRYLRPGFPLKFEMQGIQVLPGH
ncbi:MAG: hypothetical protein K8R69_06165 [Deltaproteobacteria bacterium]|nr:hypothetical protein [Deltaproteobacteria bacterium]